ncbi:hypothetical protein FB451DRAFT_1242259 [Mycena latifolia]|nr:hypothetical protein FB451DRAFT_1242259 [Mycena latifolia]
MQALRYHLQFLRVLLGFVPSSSPGAHRSHLKPISQVFRLNFPRSASSSAASSRLRLSSQASSPQITTRPTPGSPSFASNMISPSLPPLHYGIL